MRIAAVSALFGLLAGCAAARPRPETLAGPPPTTAEDRLAARWSTLARAELGDLMVLPPAPGREAVLPDISALGRAEARLRVERLGRGLDQLPVPSLDPSWRREIEHAGALLARAKLEWREGGPQRRAPAVDAVFVRARASAADPLARLGELARFLEGAAEAVQVTTPSARAWALARSEGHALATIEAAAGLDPHLKDRLEIGWQRYRAALASTPTVAPEGLPDALDVALGADDPPPLPLLESSAASAFAAARQRLYALAVRVTPGGPAEVDARVEAALPAARAARPLPPAMTMVARLRSELPRLQVWLRAAHLARASISVQPHPSGALLTLTSASATVSAGLPADRFETLGGDGTLALMAWAAVPLLVKAQIPADRAFPADPVSTEALGARDLTELLEAKTASVSPAARLLLASLVAERRARALAELRAATDGRRAAVDLLVDGAWHDPDEAEAVLDSTRSRVGVFAAPFAAEQVLAGRRGCAGLPAGPCARGDAD